MNEPSIRVSESLNQRLLRERNEFQRDLKALSEVVDKNTSLRKQAMGAWAALTFFSTFLIMFGTCANKQYETRVNDLESVEKLTADQGAQIDRMQKHIDSHNHAKDDHEELQNKRLDSLERWRRRRR